MINASGGDERTTWAKNSLRHATTVKKRKPLIVAIILLIITLIVIIIIALTSQKQTGRSESYKKVAGDAGLSATIDYDCGKSCDRKFDFNVSIYKDDGRQVSVVRPNKDGAVNIALAEGNYMMLIGKLFDGDDIFPQERLELKKGKTLEINLRY